MMGPNGFDPVSDARFRAMVEAEQRWGREQIALLWGHMAKRRDEITAIRERINGAILWAAMAAAALLFSLIKPKIGL
jgi:hypothetical protein